MWRRGVIRLVLACNWTIGGMSLGMGLYPHFCDWFLTAEDLVYAERGEQSPEPGVIVERQGMMDDERAAFFARRDHYRQLTDRLYRSGRNGWLWVSGTCAVTAVLLMIAFPKKTE